MPDRDPTQIGRVRQVLGAQITVALDEDLAGVAPIYRGRLQAIGQIGSLVRLPQGLTDLIGQVSLLSIAELAGAQAPADTIQAGDRWLRIELLGEVDRSTRRFRRGVGTFPGLDDPVHFATADDLRAVFPATGDHHLRIGRLSAFEDVPVCVDTRRLVIRHGAVVGSTGAGKTSLVASILQRFARGWPSANIVVIDPHGEYAPALAADAAVHSVLGSGPPSLRVPYWALSASDILRVFIDGTPGGTSKSRFDELVTEGRRAFAKDASWLSLDPAAVTADTPIPFDLRRVWFQMDQENNETLANPKDRTTVRIRTLGDPATLTATTFEPYGAGGSPPFKGPYHGTHGSLPERLRLALMDPRLAFFQGPEGDPDGEDPLPGEIATWLGGDKPVSILDFSGVPQRASELAVGVILSLLFDVAVRSTTAGAGIGRPRPVMVVLEEAHRYLGESSGTMASGAANRIASEGRKYGIGLLLVTQRPSGLPETALAQVGTIVALRLTNAADQGRIRAALPDSVAGLAALLPSLRTGEAVVTGEALALPARALIDEPNPQPASDDPSLQSWREPPSDPDVRAAVAAWRGAYDTSS